MMPRFQDQRESRSLARFRLHLDRSPVLHSRSASRSRVQCRFPTSPDCSARLRPVEFLENAPDFLLIHADSLIFHRKAHAIPSVIFSDKPLRAFAGGEYFTALVNRL